MVQKFFVLLLLCSIAMKPKRSLKSKIQKIKKKSADLARLFKIALQMDEKTLSKLKQIHRTKRWLELLQFRALRRLEEDLLLRFKLVVEFLDAKSIFRLMQTHSVALFGVPKWFHPYPSGIGSCKFGEAYLPARRHCTKFTVWKEKERAHVYVHMRFLQNGIEKVRNTEFKRNSLEYFDDHMTRKLFLRPIPGIISAVLVSANGIHVFGHDIRRFECNFVSAFLFFENFLLVQIGNEWRCYEFAKRRCALQSPQETRMVELTTLRLSHFTADAVRKENETLRVSFGGDFETMYDNPREISPRIASDIAVIVGVKFI